MSGFSQCCLTHSKLFRQAYTERPLAEIINNAITSTLGGLAFVPSKLSVLTTDIFLFKYVIILKVFPIRLGEWNRNIKKIK